ncbi:unnamed protein product, partial [Callosobruchus maculatus]
MPLGRGIVIVKISKFEDWLVCKIYIVGGKLTFGSYVVYVFVVYIPPNTSASDLEYFLDQLMLLNFLSNKDVIIV